MQRAGLGVRWDSSTKRWLAGVTPHRMTEVGRGPARYFEADGFGWARRDDLCGFEVWSTKCGESERLVLHTEVPE